jgi:diacylglycerol diphosphate phosphatase/phosphatidate phosphatase
MLLYYAGWAPHAYFEMLTESRNGVQSSTITNSRLVRQQSELVTTHVQAQHDIAISGVDIGDSDSGPMLDALEGGRRH